MEILTYVLLGILVAISSNFLGLGGGVIVGPILISVMLKDPHWGVGVALASAFMVTLTNTITYHKKGWVPWGLIIKVAVPAFIFSLAASSTAQMLPSRALQMLLGIVLVVLGIFLFYRKFLKSGEEQSLLYPDWFFIAMGSLSGSLSGFTGIGAGLLFMPLFLTAKQVEPGRAVACSNAAMVFSTGVGALIYFIGQSGGGEKGNMFLPVVVISLVSWMVSKGIREYQGKLAERVRLIMIIFILFFLGALTMWRVFGS